MGSHNGSSILTERKSAAEVEEGCWSAVRGRGGSSEELFQLVVRGPSHKRQRTTWSTVVGVLPGHWILEIALWAGNRLCVGMHLKPHERTKRV